jgi:hypothetical protein
MDQAKGTTTRGGYRTTSNYELKDRRLLLRGGALDGHRWVGVIGVGKRVFCGGDQPWSPSGIYLVTAETVDDDGQPANIAVPAFAADPVDDANSGTSADTP